MTYAKYPHTAIFSGPTSCAKTQRMLDIIEQEYKGHFDNIVIYVLLCDGTRPILIDIGYGVMTTFFL